MSTVHTPTAVILPSGVTIPDGGDPRNASSVNVVHETALNAIKWLESKLYAAIAVPLVAAYTPSNWTAEINSPSKGHVRFKQSSVGSAGYLHIAVPPIPGHAQLDSIDVMVGHDGSHGALPATFPALTFSIRDSFAGDEWSSDDFGADLDAVDVATYETYRQITITPASPRIITNDYDYAIYVTGETSTNAVTGFVLGAIRLNLSAPPT